MNRSKSSKRIAILYGSETGNAQDFAAILSYKLHRLHLPHTLNSLGDYTPHDILDCRNLFIICSTTGQGELPRNAIEASHGLNKKNTLWSFLKKRNLPADFLNHLSVSFLGLGDSSYPKFNYAIRKLHNRIVSQLGAKELFHRLEADEQSMAGSNKGSGASIEAVYFEYEKRILKYLRETYPTRKVNGQIVERTEFAAEAYLEPPSCLLLDSDEDGHIVQENLTFNGDDSVNVGTVKINDRLTHPEHFQDVRQFVFNGKKAHEYGPGDTISIYPCNSDDSVKQFLEIQPHWKSVADKPLKLSYGIPNNLKDGGFVKPLTLRNLLKYHCDIMSIPRTSFFMKVWTFATDVGRMERGREQLEQQREKLHQFATDEDMQDLFDYCNRPRRSLLEVLQDFPSLKLPWEFALDYLPIIKPRLFSISSGPNDPNIELTIAIVRYKTILRRIRKGICTNFIINLSPGDEFRYKVQNNNLFLNKELKEKPMILISPGVGIAPMMSLIRSDVSKNLKLFFGNRMMERDFLYKEILQDWDKEERITLYTCFSRDPKNSPKFKYVQDILWSIGEFIAKLIHDQGATIYVCGSSNKMPIQVRITILEILKKWVNFEDEDAAIRYMKDMEKDDRYLQETW